MLTLVTSVVENQGRWEQGHWSGCWKSKAEDNQDKDSGDLTSHPRGRNNCQGW